MERFLYRPQSPASSSQTATALAAERTADAVATAPDRSAHSPLSQETPSFAQQQRRETSHSNYRETEEHTADLLADHPASSTGTSISTPPFPDNSVTVTVAVLDSKLQSLLQDLTRNFTVAVGKLAQELRGEIDQLGDRTDTLESKFDELVKYVHVLEEDNVTLKQSIFQVQSQQEDLENRERRQNVRIRGIPETVPDKEIRPYLLGLFVAMAPHIPDIDWRLDRAHRSLAPKPPPGTNPRDVIARLHYYESKEALMTATRNKHCIEYKGAKLQIFSDLSPITLAKRRDLRPVTMHLQQHQVAYRWGFPFRLSASRDGTQYSMRALHECEAFVRNLGLPPIPEEELPPSPLNTTPGPLQPLTTIWTPVRRRRQRNLSTPQRPASARLPT